MKPEFTTRSLLYIAASRLREWVQFYRRDFDAPYPTYIKRKTLVSHSIANAMWIETGTYQGSMSKYLAKRYPRVVTIEPSEFFFILSKSRLASIANVKQIFGTSEESFSSVLVMETGAVNIWLDGHYSEGMTFRGVSVSPIAHELRAISAHKAQFHSIAVFIDDVRLFIRREDSLEGYPSLVYLMNWAEENDFQWQIQNDIFIAKFSI